MSLAGPVGKPKWSGNLGIAKFDYFGYLNLLKIRAVVVVM